MNPLNGINNYKQTVQKHPITSMDIPVHDYRHRSSWSHHQCIICGSKAIGINFGAPTCAPCKAFFRRNARRKEILDKLCQHSDANLEEEEQQQQNIDKNEIAVRYTQFRRCSSCRLRRCYEVGMKEELIRTHEENERHKQLVDMNRKKREMLKQEEQQEYQLSIPQHTVNNNNLLNELDWRHLSNLVYAYDVRCLKTHLEQRANMLSFETFQKEATLEHYCLLPANLTLSVGLYLKSLPAFQSLSRSNQSNLCENNLRRLILVNNHELNQSCFSEPWQIVARKTSWQFVCGPELFKQLTQVEDSAVKLWITDPIVTRLWMIVLFFSTPLFCYYDSKSSIAKIKKKSSVKDIQNGYVILLWKYLLHRHGYMESARIYSNLIHVFLNMLRIGLSIHLRFRTKQEYSAAHETLNQLTTININDVQ